MYSVPSDCDDMTIYDSTDEAIDVLGDTIDTLAKIMLVVSDLSENYWKKLPESWPSENSPPSSPKIRDRQHLCYIIQELTDEYFEKIKGIEVQFRAE